MLFASTTATAPMPIAALDGDLFISAQASLLVSAGQLDQTGLGGAGLSFASPGTPVAFHAQALFIDLAGGLWLSGPGSIHFL